MRPVRPRDRTYSGRDLGLFLFDARRQCIQLPAIESGAVQRANVFSQPGAESIEADSGHLGRFDECALRCVCLLGDGRSSDGESDEQHSK